MSPSIQLHQEPYKDLDIRLLGQGDKAAYRIAVSAQALVEQKGFKDEEAKAYALEYASRLVHSMSLGWGFTVGHAYNDSEKCWDVNVRLPESLENTSRVHYPSLWRKDRDAAMKGEFLSAHKSVVTKMATIDPESFRSTATERPTSVVGGGVGSSV